MDAWKTLDLRQRKTYGPHDGELIVLHMIPKSSWGRSERYLTGRLRTEAGGTDSAFSFGTVCISKLVGHEADGIFGMAGDQKYGGKYCFFPA